jgi:hypothetical protein
VQSLCLNADVSKPKRLHLRLSDEVIINLNRPAGFLTTGGTMLRDPELSAILDQAARNLNSLELLVRTSGEDDLSAITRLRQRLEALQIAYRNETNVLTRQVLEREVDRRVTNDRRQRVRIPA